MSHFIGNIENLQDDNILYNVSILNTLRWMWQHILTDTSFLGCGDLYICTSIYLGYEKSLVLLENPYQTVFIMLFV